jgi:hypothetical protein
MNRKIIMRFVDVLRRIGVLKNVYTISYHGQGVSLNQFYSGGHWSIRNKLKSKYHEIFAKLLDTSKVKKVNQCSLLMFFNSRHDVDNVVGLEKLFMDTIKGGYLKEDDKRFYKGLMIFHDDQLPLNTFEFIILEHGIISKAVNSRRKAQTQLFESN